MKARVGAPIFLLFFLLVALSAHPAWPADPTETGAASEDETDAQSLTGE